MRHKRARHLHRRVCSPLASALFIAGAIPIVCGAAGQASAGANRSVRDGVYSESQATRGMATYVQKCSACHDEGVKAPELKGHDFLAAWTDKSVGEFYRRVVTTMPADVPGSLKEQEVLDVTAYILQTNSFPPGDRALDNVGALDGIKFIDEP